MIRPELPADAAAIADHYDELDWIYREVWGEHVHHGLWTTGFESPEEAVLAMVERVIEEAGIRAGDSVCDVGCGYGAAARLISDRCGAHVTGITLSRTQHDHATSRGGRAGTTFVLADWLANGFSDHEFDAVVAIESVEHMVDKTACFRQAHRVLRPGGRFVFTTWLAGKDPREWERRRLLEPICREGRLPSIGTAVEYREELKVAGFSACRFEDLSERVKRTWSVCLSRVGAKLLTDARYRGYLRSRASRNREFALTLGRMWLAYETEALRYGLFVAD